MDLETSTRSPAVPSQANFRLPWGLRVLAAAGVLVPVGMIVHIADLQMGELETSVEGLREENGDLAVEREVLRLQVVEVEELGDKVEELGEERDHLAIQVAGFMGQVDALGEQLAGSQAALDEEKVANSRLRRDLRDSEGQVAALRKRERALHGIIDLLEGEIASAERRLDELTADRPQRDMRLSGLGNGSLAVPNDPGVMRENQRLRNELRKHDEQVAELLGEIGILNQELEIARSERARSAAAINGRQPEVVAGVDGQD